MSRGGRGGFGRGRGGGRGGFGANNPPPMGLTFADIQNMSREATALYPAMDSMPTLNELTEEEQKICQYQIAFSARLRKSEYYLVETTKSSELPRYSDKYRPSAASQPKLQRENLHEPFFPREIFDAYFNTRKKRKITDKKTTKRVDLDALMNEDEDEEQVKSGEEGSNAGSQAEESDYDVDEEDDNDYAGNYFNDGEDEEDYAFGGGGDEGGGGGDYD